MHAFRPQPRFFIRRVLPAALGVTLGWSAAAYAGGTSFAADRLATQ